MRDPVLLPPIVHVAPEVRSGSLKFPAVCGAMLVVPGSPVVEYAQRSEATCDSCRSFIGLPPAPPQVRMPRIGMEVSLPHGGPFTVDICDYQHRRFRTHDGGWHDAASTTFEIVSDRWRVGGPMLDLTRGRR